MRVAISGFGSLARTEHTPAIFATPGIELIAVASPHRGLDGVPWYPTLESLLTHEPTVDCVVLCLPAPVRRRQALLTLEAGRHLLLDRPPGGTLAELGLVIDTAQRARLTVFSAWPSRFSTAMHEARALIGTHGAQSARIAWQIDASDYRAGQDWVWQLGGLGVFHTGIDALSMITWLIPERLYVTAAEFVVSASGAVPVAATLSLAGPSGLTIEASFDSRPGVAARRDIEVQTRAGLLRLDDGGTTLTMDGRVRPQPPAHPFRDVYQRFQHLIETGACDVDAAPLMHVADAHLLARRIGPAAPVD